MQLKIFCLEFHHFTGEFFLTINHFDIDFSQLCIVFYRPFIVQHSKITTMEQIDLFSFGHVVFEMNSTYSLQEPFIREITDCPLALSKFY